MRVSCLQSTIQVLRTLWKTAGSVRRSDPASELGSCDGCSSFQVRVYRVYMGF